MLASTTSTAGKQNHRDENRELLSEIIFEA